MGVLYVKVAGSWEPAGVVTTDFYPAYIGVRRDGAASYAQFGHATALGRIGYNANSSGPLALIAGPGIDPITFTQANAAGTVETWLATIAPNKFQIGDIALGAHPTIGLSAMWLASQSGGADYILARDSGGDLYLNARANRAVRMRIANADWLTVDSTPASHQILGGSRFVSQFAIPTADYFWANFVAIATNVGAQARIGLYSTPVAPQVRSVASQGEKVGLLNNNSTALVNLQCLAVEELSTITTKRDVRALDRDRDRIVVRHDPCSDVVPDPDIMALRPVVFRPKVGALRLEADPAEPDDLATSTPVPEIGVLGHEGQRERLGLIAEEVQHVIPSAVTHDRDGNCSGVIYSQVTVALLDHVQRLTEEVATLRYRITELEGEGTP